MTNQFKVHPDLVDLLVFEILCQVKLDTLPHDKVRDKVASEMVDVMSYTVDKINGTGFIGYSGFRKDIGAELKEVKAAISKFRSAVLQNGVCFLDRDGRFRERDDRPWPNPSADA